jgi:hypothetical protein
MKKISLSILIIILFGLTRNAPAVSPMPVEELNLGQKETICTIHIVHSIDRKKGILLEETSSTLTFESSMTKRNVLDKLTEYMHKKFDEDNISEFKVECKFLKK